MASASVAGMSHRGSGISSSSASAPSAAARTASTRQASGRTTAVSGASIGGSRRVDSHETACTTRPPCCFPSSSDVRGVNAAYTTSSAAVGPSDGIRPRTCHSPSVPRARTATTAVPQKVLARAVSSPRPVWTSPGLRSRSTRRRSGTTAGWDGRSAFSSSAIPRSLRYSPCTQ